MSTVAPESADDQLSPDEIARLEQQARGFGVLRFRNYRLLFTGQLISTTGMWMQSLAQSWLVVDILNASAFQLGLVPIFQFGPSLIFGIPAGTLIDRWSKKNILIVTQIIYMCIALLLAILTLTGNVQLWHVYATGFAFGVTGAIDMPSRQAFVSELVPKYALKNAIAINAATFNMGRILGPAIAGVILATFGVAACFFLNAAGYLGPLFAMLRMDLVPFVKKTAGSGWSQMKEGIAYVRQTPDIRRPVMLVMVVGSFGMAYNVWLPLLATESFAANETVFGIMFSSMGFGSLLGALSVAYARGGPSRKRMQLSAVALGTVTVAIGIAAAVPLPVWIASLTLALSGFCASNTMSMANTIVQTTAPDELRGRVMAVYSTVFMGTMPLSGFIAGIIADRWSVEASMYFGGGIVAIVAAIMFFRHSSIQESTERASIPIG